jgi:small GTP-binding protein
LVRLAKVLRKVVLVGDWAVGKTSLVRRFVTDQFDDKYITTIGMKVTKKTVHVRYGREGIELTMMIWDLLGQKEYQRVQDRGFKGANGCIAVADVTRPETLRSLRDYWLPALMKANGPVPVVFFANKVDLQEQLRFGYKEIGELEQQYKISSDDTTHPQSFLTSAKSGAGVEDGFGSLAHFLLYTEPRTYEDRVVEADRSGLTFSDPKAALDALMVDFVNHFYYEQTAAAILQDASLKIGLDLRRPTAAMLHKFVRELATIEAKYGRPAEFVARNLDRREKMLSALV